MQAADANHSRISAAADGETSAPGATEASDPVEALATKMSAVFLAVSRHDGGDFLREVEESGLTLTQCRALTVISRATEDERRSARDLAEQMGVTDSTFSRAIEALVQRELVTRTEDALDRRQRQIAVTPEGRQLVSALVASKRAGIEHFAASLTSEQRLGLNSALDALLANDEVAAAHDQIRRRETS